ncbi:uncharacterized protein LY89DRAFT_540798, partial [Mollisia scopiformis]
ITPLDDQDMANAIFLPALLDFDPFLTSGAAITAMSDDVDSALENWIDTLHKHYLSFAAIAVDEVDNIDQQERFTRLVARIPKAPLFTLATLIVLSIIFNGSILGVSLWKTSLGKTHSKQVIVSVAGLAANIFEHELAKTGPAIGNVWDLFEESKEESPSSRVGISENSAGGHHFVTFVAQNGSP